MKTFWKYFAIITISVVLICSAIFCSISWFKKVHAKSHIIGSLDIDNSYTMDEFSYSNADHPIAFTQKVEELNESWEFEEELEKVPTFDGTKKHYEITLNNYLILEPNILFRAISFDLPMIFQDLDGSTMCYGTVNFAIKFYNDKTIFEVKTTSNELRQFFERYILANGFELFVKEVE